MSEPQIATLWIRTSTSPGPGAAGSATSIWRKDCGFSSWMAFMAVSLVGSGGMRRLGGLVVLGQPFAVAEVVHRAEDVLDLGQQLAVDRLRRPGRPGAHVLGVGAARDGGGDAGM